MVIRAVVWDVDDTLFDYTGADRAALSGYLAAQGREAGDGDVLLRWREITEIHWARFAAGETDYEGQRRDRVREFLGERMTDTEAEDWFGGYLEHYRRAWALFPDAVPALDALAGLCRHAVLSNSSLSHQDPKLRALGVRDRFEAVLCAAELGIAKPRPAAFHAACDALRLPPDQVAYVGVHPEIDGRGAAEAGLHSFWLDRLGAADGRPRPRSGVHRIASLAELPPLLRADTRFGAPSTFG
ncbi:HAD family hydrolase [Streptomyces sp. NPDC058045]|uniref:HAD family hydrolase n=1 Tax=Streptomyces sp. NPDC058045 TaxID=3346311 RepID=UPI0036EF9966